MSGSLLGHSVFALVASLAAYMAWSAPSDGTEKETVTMIAGAPENVTEVHWKDDSYTVDVARTEDDVAVTVQKYNTAKKPTPKPELPGMMGKMHGHAHGEQEDEKTAEAEDGVPPPPPEPPVTYPGSDAATEVFSKLLPLKAARRLGKVEETKLEDLGLKEPVSTLKMKVGSTEHVVDIGNATYGGGSYYARGPDGEIYLLEAATISSLRFGANSLLDKQVIAARENISRVAVTGGGKSREFVHRHADERAKAFFSAPEEPDTKLEDATRWFDRVFRLQVVDTEAQAPAAPADVVMTLFEGDKQLGEFKLWKPDDKTAVVYSPNYKKHVTVSKAFADSILRDVEKVVSGEGS